MSMQSRVFSIATSIDSAKVLSESPSEKNLAILLSVKCPELSWNA